MSYISFQFYLFLLILLLVYYIIPLKFRWQVLLAGSVSYYLISQGKLWWIFALTIFITWLSGILIESIGKMKNIALTVSILLVVLAWFFFRGGNGISVLGISFYSVQIISYLTDIYRGNVKAQKNLAKYALYVSFFPQIVQGPIPRYEQLNEQLFTGHKFDEREFVRSFQLIIWGFFLKLMIADKADIVVDTIFANPIKYTGGYVWTGGILYSIQIYADFLACVTLSQGIAGMFGIKLTDNFARPHFSASIKEFWRRWHISFSSWLRDYVYIPLGGSRRGKIRKYINLIITFVVSGIWHGAGLNFLAWGLLHSLYQIVGDVTKDKKEKIYTTLNIPAASKIKLVIQRIGTFFWVMVAWILFRANVLYDGLLMIKNMFTVCNPWIFFDEELFSLGLDWKEWQMLAVSVAVLIIVSFMQERGTKVSDKILKMPVIIRGGIYIFAIIFIMIFGTYGYGYNSQAFIYGGF